MPRTATSEAPDSIDTLVVPTGVVVSLALILVHALVEVEVELEALWTAALV